MSRRRWWLLAGLGLVLTIVAGLLSLWALTPRGTVYPSTPEGWAARWEAAAAEFGRTPGEGWGLWLEVSAELDALRAAGAESGRVDTQRVGELLDLLDTQEQFTAPVPESVGTIGVFADTMLMPTGIKDIFQELVIPPLSTALETGDAAGAVVWIDRAWTLARVCSFSGSLIGGLVQLALINIVVDEVRGHIASGVGADPALAAAVARAPAPDAAWSLRLEREVGLGTLEATLRDIHRPLLVAGGQLELYDEYMLDAASYLGSGDPEALSRIRALNRRLDTDSVFSARRVVLSTFIPAIEKSRATWLQARAERNALLLMLALERHKARTGVYPLSLDALVPTELDSLPENPPTTARPLCTRSSTPKRPIPARATCSNPSEWTTQRRPPRTE